MLELFKKYLSKEFVLYGIIGVSGVLIDLVTFYLLEHHYGMNYQLANCISTSLGITNNFFLNAFFNFGKTDQLGKRFVKFYTVGLVGLGVTALLLYISVGLLGWNAVISKGVIIIIVFLLQYTLNKKFSFSR